jgi:hypothetical protein
MAATGPTTKTGLLVMRVLTFGQVLPACRVMECILSLSCMWIGLDWIGLDWIGLDWIGLDWIGLDWIGLDWIGLDWIALMVDWLQGICS